MRHFVPALRIYAGADCLGSLESELKRLKSRRAVIFCGSTLGRSPLIESIRAAAGELCAGVYSGVRAHSPQPFIEEAVGELRRLAADAVIVVGGGSAVVSARAASIYLAEGVDLHRLSTSRDSEGGFHSPKLEAPKLPQIIFPTTPNTAIVKAGSAVFDPATGRRYALFDPKTRAQALFVHPDFLASPPRSLVVSASFDTLALAVEGLTSSSGDPIADGLLMHSVRLITRGLSQASAAVDDRLALMFAAILAGQGTDYTGAGVATALGHAIGANHNVENGVAKAALLAQTLRFNAEFSKKGLDNLAAALDIALERRADVEEIAAAVERIVDLLGLAKQLRTLGIARPALEQIAQRAMEDWFVTTNPRRIIDQKELLGILLQAW